MSTTVGDAPVTLEHRIALVTGGTSGIGLAVARALHKAGASVVITGRDVDRGKSALQSIGTDDRVEYFSVNAVDSSDVKRLADAVRSRFGGPDILVNNVGGVVGSGFGPFTDITDDDWDAMLALNVGSGFRATREFLPAMVERRWGRVIFISSTEGKDATPLMSAYVAAKHAVNGMMKTLAREYATTGVTVNAVCPGLCATRGPESSASAADDGEPGRHRRGLAEQFIAKMPIGRMVRPEEVADLIVFLCSSSATSITGAQLSIDGGLTSY